MKSKQPFTSGQWQRRRILRMARLESSCCVLALCQPLLPTLREMHHSMRVTAIEGGVPASLFGKLYMWQLGGRGDAWAHACAGHLTRPRTPRQALHATQSPCLTQQTHHFQSKGGIYFHSTNHAICQFFQPSSLVDPTCRPDMPSVVRPHRIVGSTTSFLPSTDFGTLQSHIALMRCSSCISNTPRGCLKMSRISERPAVPTPCHDPRLGHAWCDCVPTQCSRLRCTVYWT